MARNITAELDARRIGGGGTCFYPGDVEVYTPRSPSSRKAVAFMALVLIFALSFAVGTNAVIEAVRVIIGGKPFIPFDVTIVVAVVCIGLFVVSLSALKLTFER